LQPSDTTRSAPTAKLARLVAGSAGTGARKGGRSPSDDAIGGGMEIALMVPIFLVLGWLLDRWLGTTPIFMIVMVVLGLIGVFCRLRYSYEAKMREHEEARLAQRAAERRGPR
jgi:hypothetical protein